MVFLQEVVVSKEGILDLGLKSIHIYYTGGYEPLSATWSLRWRGANSETDLKKVGYLLIVEIL